MDIFNISLTNTLLEVTKHGSSNFPIAIYETDINKNVLGYLPLHWHEEVQFIWIIDGSIEFTVNQNKYILHKNDGLFINSGRTHAAKSYQCSNSIYICLDMSPYFIAPQDSIIIDKFISPFINSNLDAINLTPQIEWQDNILEALDILYQLYSKKETSYELTSYALLVNIWSMLIKNSNYFESTVLLSVNKENQRIKDILNFIYSNYAEKLTLEQLANIGGISRSECCRLFKRVLQQTPIEYLNLYRINQSIQLLRSSNLTVTDIAFEVGFTSSSYYISKFKSIMNYTPSAFRKANHKSSK